MIPSEVSGNPNLAVVGADPDVTGQSQLAAAADAKPFTAAITGFTQSSTALKQA